LLWQVNKEGALLVAGGRALLLQLAHPGVAAGVDEHSDFRRRPVRRLWRTLDRTLRLGFGDSRQAARLINQAHRGVRGPDYRAGDPRLLLWVHATLLDSALDAYQRFVRPLSAAECEDFYREAKAVGPLLGLPRSAYPATYGDFRAYWTAMVNGDELRVDDRARELAAAVLRPLPLIPGLVWKPFEVITAGLLPARLRDAYGLPWGRGEQRAFRVLETLIRASRFLPEPLRVMPFARRAARRRHHPKGQPPTSATQLPSGSET
jgi:uncharacterized protein (DUF2236 family)